MERLYQPLWHNPAEVRRWPIGKTCPIGGGYAPLRYDNECGDFVPWALSTLALVHSLCNEARYAGTHRCMEDLLALARTTMQDVEQDMGPHRLTRHWIVPHWGWLRRWYRWTRRPQTAYHRAALWDRLRRAVDILNDLHAAARHRHINATVETTQNCGNPFGDGLAEEEIEAKEEAWVKKSLRGDGAGPQLVGGAFEGFPAGLTVGGPA